MAGPVLARERRVSQLSVRQRKLGWLARRCFGLSLGGLVVIAVLANVAFYLSLFDNWALIRPMGALVVFGAVFVGFMFVLGFLMHAVNVLTYERAPAKQLPPGQPKRAERPPA